MSKPIIEDGKFWIMKGDKKVRFVRDTRGTGTNFKGTTVKRMRKKVDE